MIKCDLVSSKGEVVMGLILGLDGETFGPLISKYAVTEILCRTVPLGTNGNCGSH
jgi:hypothetical protein